MKGKIYEVFESVQGEGLYLGEKQLFVRMHGCNLSCHYCDTPMDRFREYEPLELVEEIGLHGNEFHSVSFTGGEPLLQKDFLKEVLRSTRHLGYKHYLETNATLPGELEEVIDAFDFLSIDLKLPSSTGMGLLWDVHRKFLRIASKKENFIKAVICSATVEDDLRYAVELIKDVSPQSILVLQPDSRDYGEHLQLMLRKFKEVCLEEKVTACIIPQVHKIAGIR